MVLMPPFLGIFFPLLVLKLNEMRERKVLSWGLNIEKDNTMLLLLVL